MSQINVTITSDLPVEFVTDILDTAFEGGINYWCSEADTTYSTENPELIVSAVLTDAEDEDEQHTVTAEGVLEALPKIIDGTYACRRDIREAITRAVMEKDCGHIDSDGADVIVQFAVFQELVYG